MERSGYAEGDAVLVDFDDMWYAAIVLGDKPGGLKVKFVEDSSSSVVAFEEVPTRVKPSPTNTPERGTSLVGPLTFVGRHLSKAFPGHGSFDGTVASYDESAKLFQVAYTDGDREDLSLGELRELLDRKEEAEQKCRAREAEAAPASRRVKKMAANTASTAFAASVTRLGPPAALTFLLAACGQPALIAAAPFLLVSRTMIRAEPGEGRFKFAAKFVCMHACWLAFNFLLAWVALLPLFAPHGLWGLSGWHALFVYAPSFTISNHVDRSLDYNAVQTVVMRYGFDAPLVSAGYLSREVFGAHLLAPFATILDDVIVQGSMPFPSDIAVLAAEPYNVGLVVNMCREWGGAAVEAQQANGVEQCWLPQQDTCAPTYESVVIGCAAISEFRKRRLGKRVYVHCKGGIARASTMTLAHYIHNERLPAASALAAMRAKRPIVMPGVLHYPAIVRLERERTEQQKKIQNND